MPRRPRPPLKHTISDAAAGYDRRTSGGSRRSPDLAELYRLLVERVSDYAIFALDPTGHILSWNPGAERFKGYTAEEIIGRHFSTFYPQEARDRDIPEMELRVALETGRYEDEGWRLRKDGTRFWANVVITALRDDSGRLVGFAKVTRDLTARREAEEQAQRLAAERAAREEAERREHEMRELSEELQTQTMELETQMEEAQALADELERTNEQLITAVQDAERAREAAREAQRAAEAANAAKTQFLAVMSHELRTPLNAIAGYAELLELGLRGPVTPAQREDLARIMRNERHLLAVINDILNYAKLDSGHVHFEMADVSVNAAVAELRSLIIPQLEGRRHTFSYVPAEDSVRVRADAEKLRQVLLNLLSNAIKFTPAGGSITVSVSAGEDTVGIDVRDTGVGIAAEKHEVIFEPFVQLDRNHTSGHDGTGLGLAISRDLARCMGGNLTVESAVGEGALFRLTLPRARPRAS